MRNNPAEPIRDKCKYESRQTQVLVSGRSCQAHRIERRIKRMIDSPNSLGSPNSPTPNSPIPRQNCTPSHQRPQIPKRLFLLRRGTIPLYCYVGSGRVVKAESASASELHCPPGLPSQTGIPSIHAQMQTDLSDIGGFDSREKRGGKGFPRQPKLPLVSGAYQLLSLWRGSEASQPILDVCLYERQAIPNPPGVRSHASQLSTDRGSKFKWQFPPGAHDRWLAPLNDR